MVDASGCLKGLITVKDIQKRIQFPNATKDEQGRLRVGAAVGVGPDGMERVAALLDEDVDVLVVDTSHGHSYAVIEAVRQIKARWNVQVVAGNIATAEAAEALIDAGADALKIGVGPGSICTTRVVAGAGVPQVTAIYDCAEVAARYGIPVVADGGIQFSGDVAKAIAAGADVAMLGSLLAGVDESPGEVVLYQGERFKEYRGMGSLGAMRIAPSRRTATSRPMCNARKNWCRKGSKGASYKGPLTNIVYQLVGGLRPGDGLLWRAGHRGDEDEGSFHPHYRRGPRESHPHDIIITKEAPNYRVK